MNKWFKKTKTVGVGKKVQKVVSQLKGEPQLQHKYLHTLFLKDPNLGRQHHELQLRLYVEYDRGNLMNFLKKSNCYSLADAKSLFEEKKLYPELIYILGITGGQSETALRLIIYQMKDVNMAIDFVQEQNDDALWDSLISMSIDNPTFLSGLLEHIGAYVDPLKLIKRIPNGVNVDGLRDRLVKIISDYNLQVLPPLSPLLSFISLISILFTSSSSSSSPLLHLSFLLSTNPF